jgi:3-methyladenine DNA glycosylase Mpg
MGITLRDNRLDLLRGKLYIDDRGYRPKNIVWSPRIGISVGTEHHWRCYADAHASVSGKPTSAR